MNLGVERKDTALAAHRVRGAAGRGRGRGAAVGELEPEPAVVVLRRRLVAAPAALARDPELALRRGAEAGEAGGERRRNLKSTGLTQNMGPL